MGIIPLVFESLPVTERRLFTSFNESYLLLAGVARTVGADQQPSKRRRNSLRIYQAIQTETQRTTLRVIATRAEDAKRKLSLYALDRVLWALEEMNLAERTKVSGEIVEQLLAFGVPYTPEVKIPDLIELVFTAQEQFMNVEPDEINRVPTIEELEAYFEQTRVA
ncbi:MAG: hypothetical protein M3Z28_11760 [Candidatus Dormibacteraeota bacterium]|nr:hypothetical protein [Candidatus Dormibacteraeota bacterium]